MIFIKLLEKILKLNLVLQIMNQIDHCLKENNKRVIGLVKHELGGKIMTKFVGLRAKTYSPLIDGSNEDKTAKDTKSVLQT